MQHSAEGETMSRPDKQADNRRKESLVTEKTDNRGTHPKSLANLTPFEKGVSGNPDGRPYKYVGLKKSLDKFANTKVSVWDDLLGDSSEQNLKDAVLHRIWKEAKNGSIQHINLLASLGCLDAD
jgi:hypothetical protein